MTLSANGARVGRGHGVSGRRVLLLVGMLLWAGLEARAQSATVSGFVTDRSSGQPLELVNLFVQRLEGDSTVTGAVTNRDGLYLIPRLPAGRYGLRASFVGYAAFADTLDLRSGEVRTLNIALAPDDAALDEVVVQTERTSGAARVTAGQQTVRPADIELVPSPDVSGDLATYLTTLPGIVSTGDRGGQLFIRGGEPSQNLVQLDGILVYQPFHILGFYSAFPADILSRTDIYAGGYGSKFGERISSVIDVWTRNGNLRRFGGAAALSPFISTLRVEGPVVPDRVSLLVSARQSLIEQGAERLLGQELPFRFGDVFAKLYAEVTSKSRLSFSALQTHDRGTLGREVGGAAPEEVRWQNRAFGMRYVLLPRILPVMAELHISSSRLWAEQGPPGAPARTSDIGHTQVALDATFFGDRVDVDAGIGVRLISIESELGGLYQNTEMHGVGLDYVSYYVEPDITLRGGLRIRPGVRLQFYKMRLDPYLEPRLRLIWTRGVHQVSGAAGLYHQEVIGLTDRRDATSIFTAWTNIPAESTKGDIRAGRMPRALHAILGYRASPTAWLDLSVEGFYKNLDNLFIGEWTAFPHFTTRLQPAEGRSAGFDLRAEVRRAGFYGSVNYGLSSTRYEAKQAALALWYGVETLRFRPAHDRRHQVNALLGLALYGFDLSARWEFGSGLPFSRAYGFDGWLLVDDIEKVADLPSTRRVIYERPFNGELPAYHRLDVSVERAFSVGGAELTLQGSVINVYDRANIFYLDVFTLRRVDQLPLVPSLGLKVAFE